MMMRRVSDAGSVDEDDGGDRMESIARLREEIRKLRDETRVALDSTAEEKAKLEAETVDVTERVEQLEMEVHKRKALLLAPSEPAPPASAAVAEVAKTPAEAAAAARTEDAEGGGDVGGSGHQHGPMRTRVGSLDSDTVGGASRKSEGQNSPSNSTKRMSFTLQLTQFLKGGAAQEGSAEEPFPSDHADTHSLDGAAVATGSFGGEGGAGLRRGGSRGAAGDLSSVQEAHKADVRQLQLKLESTESTIAMMEEISRIQQENISRLRADIAHVQDNLSNHRHASARQHPIDSHSHQDLSESPEGSTTSLGGPLDLAQLSGDAKALAMIQMKQGQRRDLVLKQELKQVRAAMEKSVEERSSLERRIAETTAQEAVLKMQMAMEWNRFAEEILDAETAKKHFKLLTKLRKRNSCRVIDMLCDSLDDVPEMEGDGDEDGRDEVIMEVLMRQSILQKMSDTLDRDAKSIQRLREVILHPLFLSTTEEVVSEVCHIVHSLGTLLDARWNRHQELWEALLERDEVLCQLQHESIRHQDTVRLLQLDLNFLRQETKMKIQTGLDAMERICQQVAVLRGELVDRDLQLAQLQHVLEENASRSNSSRVKRNGPPKS